MKPLSAKQVELLRTVSDLKIFVTALRGAGKTLSFVPTMGALHDGHLALVIEGQRRADTCLPYIFVNPTQFAPNEDLDKYPRTLDEDLKKLEAVGVKTVYVPAVKEIYPNGVQTTISIKGITEMLEGEFRPHFFDGVASVVSKMLTDCLPDIALFGEKDYQQLLVIKKLVREQNIPVKIIGVPTVRDENGLALSSRNAYLSEEDYKIAIHLNKILVTMKNDEDGVKSLLEAGFDKVDYCTIRDAQTLLPPNETTKKRRALAAAWIGKTRLIDNLPI